MFDFSEPSVSGFAVPTVSAFKGVALDLSPVFGVLSGLAEADFSFEGFSGPCFSGPV